MTKLRDINLITKTPYVHVGDTTNYTNIATDGTLTLNGNATAYIDQLGQLLGAKLESPSADIVDNLAEGTLTFKKTATTADYVVMNVQINHNVKIGSQISPHIHWLQSSALVPNWLILYRWQINGGLKTTAWTTASYSEGTTTAYTSGILHQITEFPDISAPVGATVSDIVQFRIIRDVTNVSTSFPTVDPIDASVEALSFDIHVEIDSFGSKQEYIK